MGVRIGGGVGFLKVIQQLGKPPWIPQKEPSDHRLKSRGPCIDTGLCRPGPPAGPVPAPADLLPLVGSEPGLETGEGPGLGPGLHVGHHRPVQIPGTGGCAAMAQPLMEFPDRIAQPGQLEGTQVHGAFGGSHAGQPVSGGGSGGLRRR